MPRGLAQILFATEIQQEDPIGQAGAQVWLSKLSFS
jgi:hypothetical protein